jgi:hypothetical protein
LAFVYSYIHFIFSLKKENFVTLITELINIKKEDRRNEENIGINDDFEFVFLIELLLKLVYVLIENDFELLVIQFPLFHQVMLNVVRCVQQKIVQSTKHTQTKSIKYRIR